MRLEVNFRCGIEDAVSNVIFESFQFDMASGKVLEETYRKWVQYKDNCIKMIGNTPLPQGMGKFHASNMSHHAKGIIGRGGEGGYKTRVMSNSDVWLFMLMNRFTFSVSLFPFRVGVFCNRSFDRYACWPDTPAGSMVNISCPFYLPWYYKGRLQY